MSAIEKVEDFFSRNEGSFTLHQVADGAGLSNVAQAKFAIHALLCEGVLQDTNDMPPAWRFLRSQNPTKHGE